MHHTDKCQWSLINITNQMKNIMKVLFLKIEYKLNILFNNVIYHKKFQLKFIMIPDEFEIPIMKNINIININLMTQINLYNPYKIHTIMIPITKENKELIGNYTNNKLKTNYYSEVGKKH